MTQNREQSGLPKKRRKREQISVYDAVAGRVGYEGFLTEQRSSRHRDRASTSTVAVPPDEVLFRRKGAPVRFEANDIYSADRHLQDPEHQLPDSELLKAIHAYTSDFYAGSTDDGGKGDLSSLDEAALLAVAILLEEAAEEALGKTGHQALAEPINDPRLDKFTEGSPAISDSESDARSSASLDSSPEASERMLSSTSRSDSI